MSPSRNSSPPAPLFLATLGTFFKTKIPHTTQLCSQGIFPETGIQAYSSLLWEHSLKLKYQLSRNFVRREHPLKLEFKLTPRYFGNILTKTEIQVTKQHCSQGTFPETGIQAGSCWRGCEYTLDVQIHIMQAYRRLVNMIQCQIICIRAHAALIR